MNHVVELQALLALKAAWSHKEAARKHKEALLGLSQRQKLGMTSAICCDNFSAKVFRKKLVYSERKPTRRELQDVANRIVKEWKHIARRLDVNEETIARIEIDQKKGDVRKQSFQMLFHWRESKNGSATIGCLCKALLEEGKTETVNQVFTPENSGKCSDFGSICTGLAPKHFYEFCGTRTRLHLLSIFESAMISNLSVRTLRNGQVNGTVAILKTDSSVCMLLTIISGTERHSAVQLFCALT